MVTKAFSLVWNCKIHCCDDVVSVRSNYLVLYRNLQIDFVQFVTKHFWFCLLFFCCAVLKFMIIIGRKFFSFVGLDCKFGNCHVTCTVTIYL